MASLFLKTCKGILYMFAGSFFHNLVFDKALGLETLTFALCHLSTMHLAQACHTTFIKFYVALPLLTDIIFN